jgi:predicted ATPase/DNA-binding SARP family transcriptional activator
MPSERARTLDVPAAVTYAILGPLEARRGGAVVPLGEGRSRALLAALLLEAGSVVTRDRLVDALWGDRPPATAAKIVQVYVSRLRESLGADAIRTHGSGYAVAADAEAVDAAVFERLVEGARAAPPARALALLDQALALWRGQPLADLDGAGFAEAEIARLEQLRLEAVEDRLEALLALGRHRAVVADLEALAAELPLRERPVRLLMLALYRSGRQADALEALRAFRGRLVEELGLEPSADLQGLERAILNHDPLLAAAPTVEGRSVPVPATPTVGRDEELAEAAALARRDDVRLLTLTGPPGIGKTRLALELGAAAATGFGGSAFVALAAITEPELVMPAVAQALGVGVEGPQSPLEAVAATLRAEPFLLVLDNVEQVLGAASAVAELIARAPRLTVVATSREPLHLAGEHELAVRPLRPEAAVELFVRRARAVRSDVGADDAVRDLCAQLDGVPLAIELAAARTKVLPPAAILARLGNRLDLLRNDLRDAPARHQTLRATLDWSYDLLEPEEQELLAAMSVFRGGCGLDELERVVGSDVMEPLASLVDKSLVERRGGEEARFSLLGIVREYASERLAAADGEAALRLRHASVYRELAEANEARPGPAQAASLDRLELERDNFRAAFAVLATEAPADAVALAAALRQLWQIRGPLAEGRAVLEEALGKEAGDPLVRARAHNGAGILSAELGDPEGARTHLQAAAEAAQEAGSEEWEATALSNLGNLDILAGEHESAGLRLRRIEEIWTRRGDRQRLAVVRTNLGIVALATGALDESRRLLRDAIELAEEAGDRLQRAAALRDLGRTEQQAGDAAAALEAFREALGSMDELGQRHGLAECLEGIAAVVADEEPERAAVLAGSAEALRVALGSHRHADQQAWFERRTAVARDALGAQAFADALARGRDLPVEEAVSLARA